MIAKISGYIFIVCFIACLTSLTLRACDKEYENQVNKNIQWQKDIKNGKPFTDYSE